MQNNSLVSTNGLPAHRPLQPPDPAAKFRQIYYPESKFGGFTDVDGTLAFYTRVQALLTPKSVVIDFGCGRGAGSEDPVPVRRKMRSVKGEQRWIIGLDPDPAAQVNPLIDQFFLLTDERWPLESESADLVLCDYVLEHLPDPDSFFRECNRVLRPGGYLCMRTPNILSYFGLISRLTPASLRVSVVARAQPNRSAEDVFPTHYRCNSVRKVRRLLNSHGFDHYVYCYESEPTYLAFGRWAYWLGVLHQRLAPRLLKVAIFAFAQKREETAI